jgi:hypothetical protein
MPLLETDAKRNQRFGTPTTGLDGSRNRPYPVNT